MRHLIIATLIINLTIAALTQNFAAIFGWTCALILAMREV